MCIGTTEHRAPSGIFLRSKRSKRSKFRVHRLKRGRGEEKGGYADMKLMNLRLYMENKTITEENEKLRKTAHILHQQNLALLSELQKKFPNLDRHSATLHVLFQKY